MCILALSCYHLIQTWPCVIKVSKLSTHDCECVRAGHNTNTIIRMVTFEGGNIMECSYRGV